MGSSSIQVGERNLTREIRYIVERNRRIIVNEVLILNGLWTNYSVAEIVSVHRVMGLS